MDMLEEKNNTREQIQRKLRQNFDGKIVRKDLTKKIKEGANVPVYVLEFLDSTVVQTMKTSSNPVLKP